MATRKVSLTSLQKKLDKINKAMAENKKQRAEIEKAIALQFMEENQKQVNSFRDAISKEHILLTPEDIKTVLELVRDRKKEEENVQTEDDGKSAEKSQKDENQPSEKSDEKSEKSPDEKSDENQKNDEKSPDGENENQQKTEKTSRATVMIIRLKSINRQNRMMPQNLKKLLADKVGEKRKFAKKYKRQTKPRR